MRRGIVWAAGLAVVAGLALNAVAGDAGSKGAAMSEKEKAQKEPFPNDAGPDTVDVSKYPADIQKKYELFKQCGQCHSLSRPLNSEKFKKDEWSRYVKRMMAKPGCEIKAGTGKGIFEFLTFDSNERKVKNKAAWKAHRLKLLVDFKAKHPDRWKILFENASPEARLKKEFPGW